jgi:glutaredoxin 3
LLKKKGVEFEEIDVLMSRQRRAEMVERSGGGQTVPQIFIDGRPIGGCGELFELEFDGELDAMLEENVA